MPLIATVEQEAAVQNQGMWTGTCVDGSGFRVKIHGFRVYSGILRVRVYSGTRIT